jgi:hypothetical protein
MGAGYLGLIIFFILSIIYWRKNSKKVSRPYIPFSLSIIFIGCGLLLFPMHSYFVNQNTNGLISKWHMPGNVNGKVPGIICFGGSEGGIFGANIIAEKFSRNNYVALAVAYFGIDNLPKELENIPLEYFEKAFALMKSNPMVDTNKMVVIGASRGAELALLLASRYPNDIKAVIAIAPSSYVFQGYTPHDWTRRNSTWTYNNQPLPFIPTLYEKFEKSNNILEMFKSSISQTEYLEKAAIEVEKINGPVLLISGEDDQLWPSSLMSEQIMKRLKENNFRFMYKHLAYKNAGHAFMTTALGGTHEGNDFAQSDSWNKTFEFLGEAFK